MSIPMSMDEWQSRMRSQKHEERKSVNLSKEALRKYRGNNLSESETKLSAIRQEDRLKKKLAEELHRSYKLDADLLPVSPTKQSSRRQVLGAFENNPDNNNNNTPDVNYSSVQNNKKKEWENVAHHGSVSKLASTFDNSFHSYDASNSNITFEEKKGDEHEQPRPDNNNYEGEQPKKDRTIAPEQNDFFEENNETQFGGTAKQESDISNTSFGNNKNEHDLDDTKNQQNHAQVQPQQQQQHDIAPTDTLNEERLDIYMAFGLFTNKSQQQQELFDNYLCAIDEVVKTLLHQNMELSQYVSYNPSYYRSLIKSIKKDDTYVHSQFERLILNVILPVVFVKNTNNIDQQQQYARSQIIQVLKDSVQTGSLLKIAKNISQ